MWQSSRGQQQGTTDQIVFSCTQLVLYSFQRLFLFIPVHFFCFGTYKPYSDGHILRTSIFSKISEPFLRTSKQLHLEHQKCSRYALRTSEKQILRTYPLIFCILRTLNTHILRTCPVTLVNLYIHTNTLVNTILRTLSPLTAATFYTFSSGTISQAVFAAMGRSLVYNFWVSYRG